MRREPYPFFHLIVAAFPVVSVYAANLAYVPPAQIVRPLLFYVGATAVAGLLVGRLLRNPARGAGASAVAILCFFAYGGLASRLGEYQMYAMDAWVIGTLTLVLFAAWAVRRARHLNVLATFIALIAAVNLGLSLAQAARLATRRPRATLGAGAANVAKPDVFYIVLDGHGRSDAIRRAIGFDNSAFVAGLRARGFYVADESHSNYCQTELSLSSSLNMDYVPRLLPAVDPKTQERKPLADLIDDNEVMRRMRAEGYRTFAVTTGFPAVHFSTADVQIGSRWAGTMVESTLIQMTPLAKNQALGESQFATRRRELVGAFENVAALASPTVQPRFVVVHVLAPHPPFVFDADGKPLPKKGGFGYWDGDDYTTFSGTAEEYRRGYAGQAAWVERETLAAVDRLLAGAGPARRPVIVIQGDHGSKLRLAQNSLAKTDLHECFPILNAYLVPDAVRKDLRPDITPVNSFRLLLRTMFGNDLPPLPDRSYYSGYATPYDFTDVTDRIEPVGPALTAP